MSLPHFSLVGLVQHCPFLSVPVVFSFPDVMGLKQNHEQTLEIAVGGNWCA